MNLWRAFIGSSVCVAATFAQASNELISVNTPEAVRATDIAYVFCPTDSTGSDWIEGVSEGGVRFRIIAEQALYNDRYTAIRVHFDHPVRGFGVMAGVSSSFGGTGFVEQSQPIGQAGGAAIVDVGAGGYAGFVTSGRGVTSVLLTSRSGSIDFSHFDLRPEPIAREDRIEIQSGTTAMLSPHRLQGNDSFATGAVLESAPSHAQIFNLSPDGLLTYRPEDGFLGVDRFSYRAVDANGDALSEPAIVELIVTEVKVEAVIVVAKELSVAEDSGAQLFPGWVSGMIGAPPMFEVEVDAPHLFKTLPAIDPEGTLRFETAANAHGSSTLAIRMLAADSTVEFRTCVLSVLPVNDTPILEPIGNEILEAGDVMMLRASATELDEGQSVRYQLIEGPAGAIIDPMSGLLVWRAATKEARHRFVVRAIESGNELLSTDQSFVVEVVAKPAAPRVVTPAPVTVRPGQTVTLTLASDAKGDRFFLGSDEPGASLNPSSGRFTWTPAARNAGQTERFLITAVREGLCTMTELVIHVAAGSILAKATETRGMAAMPMVGALSKKPKGAKRR